jgi:hypothetical protein
MTTDRELLEAAAKAAGIELAEWTERDFPANNYWSPSLETYWNPLTDDGDALRLAVKLRLSSATDEVWVISHSSIAEYERDPYAATRRAITRAAAKLGEDLTG